MLPARGGAQAVPPPPVGQDSVTVVPGARYRAGGLHRALAGSGYRDLWIAPLRVPVASLATLAGGLTPVELGGGTTTQTLHLRGADGRRYVFRSVDKIPRDLLEDLEGTPAEAIIQDQMSSFNPSGALVVPRLLDAVGVLHPTPQLMVVPDDPALGEFRAQFAGLLVLFEERPDDLPDGRAGFAGSTRIVQTDDLFEEMEDDPSNRLAADELLRGRLIDLLLGDRDRSVNNHLWARFERGDGYLWRPVPRDRDQAFVRFDGLLKSLARRYDSRLVSFADRYSDTEAVSRNAWDVDRRLLVGMDRATWDATVRAVRDALTDQVIHEAIGGMPAEHRRIVGDELESALRLRRDALPQVAEEFYEIVFRYADVSATKADEDVRVDRGADGSVRVSIAERGAGRAPYYDRTFFPDETREIRLYLGDGDDHTTVAGPRSPIRVRIVGQGGADEIESADGSGVTFYDGGNRSVVRGDGIDHEESDPERPFAWFEEHYDLDWGGNTLSLPVVSYDPDRGLVPTLLVQSTRFGFARLPYSSRLDLSAGWSIGHEAPLVHARFLGRDRVAGADLILDARYSGIDVLNFFGFGNETPYAGGRSFYKVEQEQLTLMAALGAGDGETWALSAGPVFKWVETDTTDANLLSQAPPVGAGSQAQVGLRLAGSASQVDRAGMPTRGLRAEGGLDVFPGVADLEDAFVRGAVEVDGYWSPFGPNLTLAARLGGAKVWGTYPYYEAAFLGGSGSLRGQPEERFAGDAMLYGGLELRTFLARITLLLPMDVGVFGLFDGGRTWVEDESSGAWHRGAGGGLWFAPLRRSTAVHIAWAQSEGRRSFYGGVGFAF